MSQVLVASNRGPVSFSLEDGALTMRRGGGGLVSGLAAVTGAPRDPGPPRPAGATVSPGTGSTATGAAGTGAEPPADDPDVLWVCASLGEGDRTAARRSRTAARPRRYDTGGAAVRMLDIPEATFQRAYNGVANSTLWFVHHLLYHTPRSPPSTPEFRREWAVLRGVQPRRSPTPSPRTRREGAGVLVQDYHLALVPGHAARAPSRPADRPLLAHAVGAAGVLPAAARRHRARRCCAASSAPTGPGSSPERWARAFTACCERLLGARSTAPPGPSPTGPSPGSACTVSAPTGTSCASARTGRTSTSGLARAARAGRRPAGRRSSGWTGPSCPRTSCAACSPTGELLADRPEWRGRVVHVAFAYPSRQDLAVYREYTAEVQRVAERDQRRVRHGGLAAGRPPRQRRLRALAGRLPAGGRGCWSTRSGTA